MILHLTETASTQDVARMLAAGGCQDGTLVWADRQTSGRGRMKRKWQSAPGGLYFSLILRRPIDPRRLPDLSLASARAVARCLPEVEPTIKPPNDVYARGKKLAGILIEAAGGETRVDWVVVGVGVNVNNAPSLKTAVSLKQLTRRSWDVEALLKRLAKELDGIA